MAIVLIQEREEAFVIARRHSEQLDELAVVALRPLQPRLDDLTQVGLGQLAVDERRIDDRPEALAAHDHLVPEDLGARLGLDLRARRGLAARLAGESDRVENFRRQILGNDVASGVTDDEAFDDVLQLPNVPRPTVRRQDFLAPPA